MPTREEISRAIELAGDAGDMAAVRELGAMLKTSTPKPLSAAGEVKRGLGLGTRNVIEGATQLLGIVGDPLNAMVNAATGANFGSMSGTGAQLADTLGLPREQGSLEQATGAMVRAGTGALIPAAGANALVARGGGAIAQALAAQPVMQVASGGAAGLGGELARQGGYGVLGQLAASLLGGFAPFAGAAVGRGVANTVAAIPRGPQFP